MAKEEVVDIFSELKQQILESLPENAQITSLELEGPEVAVYSKNPKVLLENGDIIKEVAKRLRKRIVIRSDPSIRLNPEEVKKIILEVVPQEAEVTNIMFDHNVGEVIIEAKKPGLVIGRGGVTLREIIKRTFWRPAVVRSPPIKSKTISLIRTIIQSESNQRKRILRNIGQRIHRPILVKDEWIRLSTLGGFREVGRTAILVRTSESSVLIDCGVNVGSPEHAFPHLDAPEFDIEELDAVIVTHAHLDHSGFVPFLFKYGYEGPVYCTQATRNLMTLLQLDYLDVAEREGKLLPYSQKDVKKAIMHTIPLEYGEVTDIAPDIRLTLHNAGHILGCVTPDTLVVLGDGSIISISELLNNNLYLKHGITPISMNKKLQFEKTEALVFKKESPKELYKITTSLGYTVAVTPEHPFFRLRNGKIEVVCADQIKKGDRIATVGKWDVPGRSQKLKTNINQSKTWNSFHIVPPLHTNEDLCQIVGYMLGRRHKFIYRKKKLSSIILYDKNAHILEKFREKLVKIFKFTPRSPNMKIRKDRYRGEYYISIGCRELLRFLELNFKDAIKRASERLVPIVITKCTKSEIAKFLEGLYIADGEVRDNYIEFRFLNERLARTVQLLLLRFGIISSLSSIEQSGGKVFYMLTIADRKSLAKLSELVEDGDYSKDLIKIKANLKKSEELPDNLWKRGDGQVVWDEIVAVEKIPSKFKYVYDLSVPNHHNFITNGIVSHNSAIVHLHIGEGLYNIAYTGDFKFAKTRLLEPATYTFPRLETLIIESTYGAPSDIIPPRKDAERQLMRIINSTIERRGKVLIPVLAVGRAQEMMLVLEDYMRRGLIKEVPVYVDGMISEATAIHTTHPEYLARSLRDKIFHEGHNPFLADYFVQVDSKEARTDIVEGEPCIIMSTSGMLTGGPSVEYFKLLAPDPKNSIIFVSYQIEGTLGRRVQKGWKEIPMRNREGKIEVVNVKMEVHTIEGFSGHSDRRQLLSYIQQITPKPEKIITCHGENNKCITLANVIHKKFRIETRVPYNLETIRLR